MAMTLADFSPAVQTAMVHLVLSELSLAEIGERFFISKQAVAKRLIKGMNALANLNAATVSALEQQIIKQQAEINRLNEIIRHLQRVIVLHGVIIFLLKVFRDRVLAFFPTFKVSRLKAHEKKQILDHWAKFERLGGSLKKFAEAAGRAPETIRGWIEAYEKWGMAGLADKRNMPRHFGNRISVWVRDQLLALFLRFPEWTPYQYHKYLAANPAIGVKVSLPAIASLKEHHVEKSEAEKERIRKRWAFAPGSAVWTVDFTVILKTPDYKLQLLTVSDARSRFLLDSALFLDTATETVTRHLEDLFIKYGKPGIIKADNGPEFRLECRKELEELGIYLFNSPIYYGQFNGGHERIHRELKTFISNFDGHRDLMRLMREVERHRDSHNFHWPLEVLNNKPPAQIFYGDPNFIPQDVEVVAPYIKDGELRMKFSDRKGGHARVSIPVIENGYDPSGTYVPSKDPEKMPPRNP